MTPKRFNSHIPYLPIQTMLSFFFNSMMLGNELENTYTWVKFARGNEECDSSTILRSLTDQTFTKFVREFQKSLCIENNVYYLHKKLGICKKKLCAISRKFISIQYK